MDTPSPQPQQPSQQPPTPPAGSPPPGGTWVYWAPSGPPPGAGWAHAPAEPAPVPAQAAEAPPTAHQLHAAAPSSTPPGAPPRPPSAPVTGPARWDLRAYGALVDISICAGLLTAYQMMLAMVTPLVRLLVFLFGGNYGDFVRLSYWVIIGGWWAWQWAQRGVTGQSLGQRLMGVAVVDAETRRPIGPARSLVRSLTHVLDVLPLGLGFVRPVWDPERATWADKIHKTTAIQVVPAAGRFPSNPVGGPQK